jgi:hypothetical protein
MMMHEWMWMAPVIGLLVIVLLVIVIVKLLRRP